MDYQYYMNSTIQQFYYNQIKDPKSPKNAVDNFWLNVLPGYFRKKLSYGIEQESRRLSNVSKQRADWTIRYIRNGIPKVVLIDSQSSAWKEALDQLTRYMNLARCETEEATHETLYGAINIGTYTRFYQLDPSEAECIDYPGTNGEPYELAKNEKEIHSVLLDLVQRTSN